ncbi:MAG: class C sortase [Firmicutes bacterium]|nr:class C sortase [Bacillota bacterium]
MKKINSTKILIVIFIMGLSLLVYPSLANYWNSFHASRAVASYREAVVNMDNSEYEQILSDAKDYNDRLALDPPSWHLDKQQLKEYKSVLDISGTGIMGYVEIPKLHIELPIYHGTDEGVLQIAIGHIAGTSLPVGGNSSHCVISGHRGLPSARLFTDIDRLVEGDLFKLNILDETLTYEVDQIRIVLPEDVQDLKIEEGKDYCTLVTCTPYGINSHRLLVRGHRVDNGSNLRVSADAVQINRLYIALITGVILLIILFTFVLWRTRK